MQTGHFNLHESSFDDHAEMLPEKDSPFVLDVTSSYKGIFKRALKLLTLGSMTIYLTNLYWKEVMLIGPYYLRTETGHH